VLRHNDFRDLNIDLLKKSGLTQVIEEPVLKESSVDGTDGLRVDWSARSFWESQREALFDCCIINADAPSHKGTPLDTLLASCRNVKKKKYCPSAEQVGSSFTPVVATCEAIFDSEAEVYIKKLASLLAHKWKKKLFYHCLLHQSKNASRNIAICQLVHSRNEIQMEKCSSR